METLVLDAQVRDLSVKPQTIRKQKMIPAICYGQGQQPAAIQVQYSDFRKIFRKSSTTQVITLAIDGKEKPVLVHDLAYNPVTDEFIHVDFLVVNLKVAVEASVPVEVVGVSPAIKNFGGLLTVVKHEVEVKCLPMDIPHEIKVDISKLEKIGDAIHISELIVGPNVEILAEPEEVVVTVAAPEDYVEASVEVPDELKAEPKAEETTEKKE